MLIDYTGDVQTRMLITTLYILDQLTAQMAGILVTIACMKGILRQGSPQTAAGEYLKQPRINDMEIFISKQFSRV